MTVPDTRVGVLCTEASTVAEFLSRNFDPVSETFIFNRESGLWDAVEAAHAAGRCGDGQTVAVLDSGFDLSVHRLSRVCTPGAGALENRRGHGTVVALLINEIAPKAALTLFDVKPGNGIRPTVVAKALREAFRLQVDVVNLSLGIDSDAAAPSRVGPSLSVLADFTASTAVLQGELRSAATHSPFFDDGGCSRPCAICDAMDLMPDSPITLIAAAGNEDKTFCPGSHDRCLSTGFQTEQIFVTGKRSGIFYNLPGQDQSLGSDLTLTEPPGFGATSFASPLFAGLVAISGPNADAERLLDSVYMVTYLYWRHTAYLSGWLDPQQDRSLTVMQAQGVKQLYDWVFEQIPTAHQHSRTSLPCALCGVAMLTFYTNVVPACLAAEDFSAALRWSDIALAVNPLAPSLLQNKAAALRYQALAGQATEPAANFAEAIALYEAAAARRPSDSEYQLFCESMIAAIKIDATLE